MDSYDNELVWVLLFEAFEIRDHMDAVDTAVGPEVENDNLALQVAESDWF